MGAGQSADKADDTQVKTSYYELLGIQRQATEDEIKKAYRRKALELHPDRNYGNEQEATKVFAEVQAAYEVLSDPQERAWYDSHETAILRGDDVGSEDGVPTYENVRMTSADDLARMVRKFNSNVDFTDAPSGFFGFLRDIFDQLAKEEEAAAMHDGTDYPEYPTFGHKDDAYDDVVKRFYLSWTSFSTVKSFSWKDKYRLSEAPDRWYRRRMEQENKKFRQDAIREFNDAVRSLVAFVRKRDPRYVPSTQTEEERQKILRDAAAAQAARARAANEEKLSAEVPELATSRDHIEDELEGNFDEEESEEEHVFECVACNKIFKSERQWEAHEKSKKHQKAIYALQKKMRKENAHLDLDASATTSGVVTPDVDSEEEGLEEEVEEDMIPVTEDDIVQDASEAEEDGVIDEPTKPTTRTQVPIANGASPHDSSPDSDRSDDEDHDEDDDYASPDAIAARLQSTTLDTPDSTTESPDDTTPSGEQPGKRLGKAAQKRAKKAAAAAAGTEAEATHKCVGCAAAFPTKTRLFQHLKDHPGHAALKPAVGGAKGKKGKGKR